MLLVVLAVAFAEEPPSEAPAPSFGTDVSVGAGAGALLGAWPDPGVHGFVGARVDLFPVSRDAPGARLGASVWGRSAVWPLQTHTGDEDEAEAEPFHLLQYGLSAIVRYDPAAPMSGTFGFGFSRVDLDAFEGGVYTIPVFSVEAGLRQKVGNAFVDYGLQSGWGSARSSAGGGWDEWWTVNAAVSVGFHAR